MPSSIGSSRNLGHTNSAAYFRTSFFIILPLPLHYSSSNSASYGAHHTNQYQQYGARYGGGGYSGGGGGHYGGGGYGGYGGGGYGGGHHY